MLHENNPQAEAIWPQQQSLFDRYALPEHARIRDVGCGTGEISSRLAVRFPLAEVTGVDSWTRPARMAGLGRVQIQIEYLTVDTLRVPRETFATIMQAWCDGYCSVLCEHTDLQRSEVGELFEQVINTVLDPDQYAVWRLPVISAMKPA